MNLKYIMNLIMNRNLYNESKLKNLLKKVRDFVRCCKKTTIEIDSMLEELNRIHSENQPKPRKANNNKDGG